MLYLDGDTIWQQTAIHNGIYVRNTMTLVTVVGVVVATALVKRNRKSIINLRRCFFLAGLALVGVASSFVPRYFGDYGAVCLVLALLASMVVVPLFTFFTVKRDSFVAD